MCFHLLPVYLFYLAVSWRYLRVISCSFPFASHHLLSFSPALDCLSTGSGGGFQHKKPRWWYKVTHRCRKTAYDGLTATETGKGTFVARHSKIRIMTGGEAPGRECHYSCEPLSPPMCIYVYVRARIQIVYIRIIYIKLCVCARTHACVYMYVCLIHI